MKDESHWKFDIHNSAWHHSIVLLVIGYYLVHVRSMLWTHSNTLDAPLSGNQTIILSKTLRFYWWILDIFLSTMPLSRHCDLGIASSI